MINLQQSRRGGFRYDTGTEGKIVKFEVYYSLGGTNFLSGRGERRGIYVSLFPTTIERREGYHTESFVMFQDNGVKFCVAELARKSDKKLAEIAAKLDEAAPKIAHLFLVDREAGREAMRLVVEAVRIEPLKPITPKPAPAVKGMQLMTSEIAARLEKNPVMSGDAKTVVPVIAKFFTPDSSWTWYVLEGDKTEDGDYEFFGLVEGHEKELGYFRLSELQAARGQMNLPVERDRHFDGYVVDKSTNEVRKAA